MVHFKNNNWIHDKNVVLAQMTVVKQCRFCEDMKKVCTGK